jgi:uncharacterized HAD superfamily protein
MKQPLPSAIIVDLDGTLCDTSHRQHFMTTPKNWPAFYAGIKDDKLNLWCADILDKYDRGMATILVSGRPDEFRKVTEKWLSENEIGYDQLLMRKTGDYRADSIVKKEIYDTHLKDKFNILFCIDDRQQVVDMWRSLGLTCLQCAKGDF